MLAAGAYILSVVASNPLGNISYTNDVPFYVQIPPTGLWIKDRDSRYYTALGNKTTIQACLMEGTDVKFDWDMDDQQEYVDQGKRKLY